MILNYTNLRDGTGHLLTTAMGTFPNNSTNRNDKKSDKSDKKEQHKKTGRTLSTAMGTFPNNNENNNNNKYNDKTDNIKAT